MSSMFKHITILVLFIFSIQLSAQNPIDKKYSRELARLADNSKIQYALNHVLELEPTTREDHIMLTEIPAPLNMERERAEKFLDLLKQSGADSVWIDKAGNAIALRRGTKGEKLVAINGHMDTVFPDGTDCTVKFRGDTLFAPGIGDDTRGLIIILTVLRAMEEAGIETEADVIFVGTVGEEGLGDLKGSKYLFNESGMKIDSWISVDGGSIANIVTSALGSIRYRINFEGPGGHSWGAFGYVNPIHALSTAIDYFVEEADNYTSSGPKTSYNVGRIGGGTSINSIPYHAWAEVDMRSESPEKLKGIEDILLSAVDKAHSHHNELRRSGPELVLDMQRVGIRPSGKIDSSIPLVQRAMTVAKHFGATPQLNTGSTDASIPISKGIPAITIGRGGQGGANHSLDEWWINTDGYIAIQNALLLLIAESGFVER